MKILSKSFLKRTLFGKGNLNNFTPSVNNVDFGDFRRTQPFSRKYGFDRGGAIDRYYIENFLDTNRSLIKGIVLEVANNKYTLQFGGSNVSKSEVLHVNPNAKDATIIADLGAPLAIKENQFDCIILTQTLQFIFDFEKAIENCFRLLKPGGHLLLTVPGITPIGKDPFDWYWSFTSISMKRIMAERFGCSSIDVRHYGNVLSATGFLYGMGRSEIRVKDLDVCDPSYQVIISVVARKEIGEAMQG